MPLLTPESSWRPPAELPDLRGEQYIALDRETKDDGLARGHGPGWAYPGAGYIAGTAIAWPGGAFYAPLRHPEGDNIDLGRWKQWEEDHIRAGVRFVFQNGPYDLGWGRRDLYLPCPEHIDDTTAMAVMVDENRLSYDLDALAAWRGLPGKDESLLREAAAAYGYAGGVKSNLWRLPARYVGPYAEQDAVATLRIYESLLPEIEAQGLGEAYRLEMDLVPMVQEMRWRGIRIDIEKAEKAQKELILERDQLLLDLGDKLGVTVGMEDMRSARRLERFFDEAKIAYPRTPKTKTGQFDKDWMEDHPHWLPQAVVAARAADDGANKFLGEYILGYANRGRIHASINQWRTDDGGTRSHRFSYSDPPLQQQPGDKQPKMRDLIRGVFRPEEGELWMKADFAQQEVKLIVHFAKLLGCAKAGEAAQKFIDDPLTDYHSVVAEITGLDRRHAKDVTFAKAYGAGVAKFALMNGCTEDEARARIEQYDREMPFVKQLNERCQAAAEQRGFIKLIDGARCHFDLWECATWKENRDAGGKYLAPRALAAAQETWPGLRLRRAFTHKAMNRLIQGSAARQVKIAMRDCWREGIVPLLQLHDELDLSLGDERTGARVMEIMQDCCKFEIPIFADSAWGVNWAHARKIKGGYGGTWAEARGLLGAKDPL